MERTGDVTQNETVKYLQQDRLFLLRDYNMSSEQIEVNIVLSLMAKKTLDLEVLTKGEYVSMSMNLNKWHSYLTGGFNKDLNITDEIGNATISNSVFLQVFKINKNKMNLWELVGNETILDKTIADNNWNCTDSQNCKKFLADDWGLFQFNIPRKNCSTIEVDESLSSSTLINEYMQVLLKIERLDDFNTSDKDIDEFGGADLRSVFRIFRLLS